MDVKILIASPSPRDIAEVLEHRALLPYDQLFAKYMTMDDAYCRLQSWFLDHREYSHFVFAPDDLVVKPANVERLVSKIRELDPPVISGVCNVDMDGKAHLLAIAHNLPNVRHVDGSRKYEFYRVDEYDAKQEIVEVPWSGFPLMAIRRDVMERIKFEGDAKFNGHAVTNTSWDVIFCWNCAIERIPVLADMGNQMVHLRYGGKIKVGLKRPRMLLGLWAPGNTCLSMQEIPVHFSAEQREPYLAKWAKFAEDPEREDLFSP